MPDLKILTEAKVYKFIIKNIINVKHPTSQRPLVLLTYAQTIDGFISGPNKVPLKLSSDESSTFTHVLRATHNAILVGIGTIESDDPMLSTRLASPMLDKEHPLQPIPVIIDPSLRITPSRRVLNRSKDLPASIIYTTENHDQKKRLEIEGMGATVVVVGRLQNGFIDLDQVLTSLKREFGIARVMIEGGCSIIESILDKELLNTLAVTITPSYQKQGIRIYQQRVGSPSNINANLEPLLFSDPVYEIFGPDIVMIAHTGTI